MTKPISIKMEDATYDDMMSYAKAKGKSLTGFSRGLLLHGFHSCLQTDNANLDRFQRMLEDPDKYQLSSREKADLEHQVILLKSITERFNEFYSDLTAELYGDSDNA